MRLAARLIRGGVDVFTPRLLTVIILTCISVLFLLPLPWQKQSLFFWGYHAEGVMPFPQSIKFENSFLNIFVKSTDFPSLIRYYNVHFVNQSEKSEYHDIIFMIEFREESPFWDYAKNSFEKSFYDDTSFELYEGKSKIVKAVPIEIPVTYSSIPFCIGNNSSGCPEDLWFISDDGEIRENPRDMLVYATPNFYSWLIQLLLIFAFWAVVVNSLVELTRKK